MGARSERSQAARPGNRSRRAARRAAGAARSPEPIYTLTDLAQIKVLADPLRQRILEALGEERTTKQIASLLGEPPTRLYHHVLALERVGLIVRTRTRQKRGTVEKYWRAVARAFRADARLFGGVEAMAAGQAAAVRVASGFLERTRKEMNRLGEGGDAGGGAGDIEEGVLGFLEVRTSQAEIGKLRDRLKRLIEIDDLTRWGKAKRGDRRFRLTVAFFPLDRFPKVRKTTR